jgi:superfamily I DNA/RNA helicase
LLIIAGAGSGKTNTLAHRAAHLILNGADPKRILLLTFTRRAAAEMTRAPSAMNAAPNVVRRPSQESIGARIRASRPTGG